MFILPTSGCDPGIGITKRKSEMMKSFQIYNTDFHLHIESIFLDDNLPH